MKKDSDVMSAPNLKVKIVVLGDGGVGKTSFLVSYKEDRFPMDYVPTIFENFTHDTVVEDKHIQLSVWDTAGQEGYDRLRPLSYPDADVFFLCFALDLEDSLNNVEHKWVPDVRQHCKKRNLILDSRTQIGFESLKVMCAKRSCQTNG